MLDLPVTSDGLNGAVVPAKWDVKPDDGLAGCDKLEVLVADAGHGRGLVVKQLDLLEETRLVVLVKPGACLNLGGERSHGWDKGKLGQWGRGW